jgi:ribosomal protein S18 acetylase RimI-like enzyme
VSVRPAEWERDADAIGAIDTSFTTDRVYRFGRERGGFGFAFPLVTTTPVTKSYLLPSSDSGPGAFVAEADGEVVGFAQVDPPAWNGQAVVRHLYVSVRSRGRGFGAALVEAMDGQARAAGARCLWAETQNVNHPAIQFYLARGFYLCGFDESFYDPVETPGEFAFFFSLPLL